MWLVLAALAGIVGQIASAATGLDNSDPADPPNTQAKGSPVRFDLSYGSANDPSAVFHEGVPELPPPLGYEEKKQWIRDNNGTLANSTVASLAIAAPEALDAPVYIDDVRVRPIECAPAVSGVYVPGVGAGDLFDRVLDYDLDAYVGNARTLIRGMDRQLWRFPLWVDATETEVIAIMLNAYSGSYVVEIDVDYRYEGKSHSVTLSESTEGDPLAITGRKNGEATVFVEPGVSDYSMVERGEVEGLPAWAGPDPYAWTQTLAQSHLSEPPPFATC